MNPRIPRSGRFDIHRSSDEWDKLVDKVKRMMEEEHISKSEAARRFGVGLTALNSHIKKREQKAA
jgi:hypothetical protein